MGNHLVKQREPLGRQLDVHAAQARDVAARPGEIGDEAVPDRVADADEDDRDRRGCAFCRQCRRGAAAGRDQLDLAADQIGGQRGQPIITSLHPAVFNREILPIDIARRIQRILERSI